MVERFLSGEREQDQGQLDGCLSLCFNKILVGNRCHVEGAKVKSRINAYDTKWVTGTKPLQIG